MSYDEAIRKLGAYIGTETWHDYMGGSYLPNCRDESGIIRSLSTIFDVDIKKVKSDIYLKSEEQFKSM